jgi:hypothetical protein
MLELLVVPELLPVSVPVLGTPGAVAVVGSVVGTRALPPLELLTTGAVGMTVSEFGEVFCATVGAGVAAGMTALSSVGRTALPLGGPPGSLPAPAGVGPTPLLPAVEGLVVCVEPPPEDEELELSGAVVEETLKSTLVEAIPTSLLAFITKVYAPSGRLEPEKSCGDVHE